MSRSSQAGHTWKLPWLYAVLLTLLWSLVVARDRDTSVPASLREKLPELRNSNALVTSSRSDLISSRPQENRPAVPVRSIDNWSTTDLLLVSTIDGSLHARDRRTGRELWSIAGDGPLVRTSSLLPNTSASEEDRDITWIVEPYGDGSLYYFMPSQGLRQPPVTIKQLLLESPFAIDGDDKTYTGSFKTDMYSIDSASGEILNDKVSLGPTTVFTPGEPLGNEDFEPPLQNGSFMIGRTIYHLEIRSQKDTDAGWNIVFVSWGLNNQDIELAQQHTRTSDDVFVYPLPEGQLLATDKAWKTLWVDHTTSTVVDVFDVLESKNSAGDPLILLPQPQYQFPETSGSDKSAPGTYINRTEGGSWFALSLDHFPSFVQEAAAAQWCLDDKHDYATKEELASAIIGVHPTHPHDQVYGHTQPTESVQGHIGEPLDERPTVPLNVPSNHKDTKSDRQNEELKFLNSESLPSNYGTLLPVHYAPTWWQIFTRLIENVISILLIVVIISVAARLGWLPQIVEWLEHMLLLATGRRPDADKAEVLPDADEKQIDEKLKVEVVDRQIADPVRESLPKVEKAGKPDELEAIESPGSDADLTDTEGKTDVDADAESKPDNDKSEELGSEKHVKIADTAKLADGSATPARKRKRGSRGGRKNASKEASKEVARDPVQAEKEQEGTETKLADDKMRSGLILPSSGAVSEATGLQESPLTVTDEIIGYGSQGTVVYQGLFENRAVAVKRMLLNFYDIASQEVTLLQESDDHPNVIRYYCKYQSDQFLYIALELCPGTLEDVIEKPFKFEDLVGRMNPTQVLYQIASGLHHLHSLKIVHRDIKPQNILVAPLKRFHRKNGNKRDEETYGPVRMLISDFGLCKKLEGDQSSFRPTTAQPAGTAGWTAPEISMGSRYPSSDEASSSDLVTQSTGSDRRLTRAVDIFSLGCVFYYVLSGGQHPFGVNSKRESNIEENNYCLSELEDPALLSGPEATDLISKMISFNPRDRPDAATVLLHPLFWSPQKRLEFLLRISDRFEADTREEYSELLSILEQDAAQVVGEDWHTRLDKDFIENLGKYRKYHGDRIIDLLRAMRNKSHHFNDLPPPLQKSMGPLPEGFLAYFTRRFPNLLISIYYFARQHLATETAFRPYFEPEDHL